MAIIALIRCLVRLCIFDLASSRSVRGAMGRRVFRRFLTAALGVAFGAISGSATAELITFTDTFDRPNGVVGNGWLPTSGNVNGDLLIGNGALTTPYPGGFAGIYRPIDFTAPVTISGTLTQTNGFGPTTNRYESGILLGTSGSLSSGYEVLFQRSESIANNSSVMLFANGIYSGTATLLAQQFSPFQYGTSITPTITYTPSDGRISGSVTSGTNTFNFDFGSVATVLPGTGIGLNLEFPDSRSPLVINPTFDNVTISYGGTTPPPQKTTLPTPVPTQQQVTVMSGADMLGASQRNADNRLEVFRNGQFQSLGTETINASANTYVLVHGWNGPNSYYDKPRSLGWVEDAAAKILLKEPTANILAWNWTASADSLKSDHLPDIFGCVTAGKYLPSKVCGIVPLYQVDQQSLALTAALRVVLAGQSGASGDVGIQFIGHSLGAAISAKTVAALSGDAQPLPIKRLTLFDAPDNASAAAVGGKVNLDTILPVIQSNAPQIRIENYLGGGIAGGDAEYDWLAYGRPYTGVPGVSGPANTLLAGYAHAALSKLSIPGVSDWYLPTIPAKTGLAATRGVNEPPESLIARAGEVWANQNRQDDYDLSRIGEVFMSGLPLATQRALDLISQPVQYALRAVYDFGYSAAQLAYDVGTVVGQAVVATVQIVTDVSKGFAEAAKSLGSLIAVGPGAAYLPFEQQTAGSTPAFVTGSWSAQGQAEAINGLGLRLTTHSPSYAFTTVHIPDWADAMLVDFRPELWSCDDLYLILFDDQAIFALMGAQFQDDFMDTGFLDISRWAGHDVLLTIGYLSDIAGNSVLTRAISFFDKEQLAEVPEPATILLVLLGVMAIVVSRRRGFASA